MGWLVGFASALRTASLTPVSGVVAVAELAGRLGVLAALDDGVGAIKQRDRGLSAGGLLLALGQSQMLGRDFLVSLDRRRGDLVGEALSAVPTPASTTAAQLAARFDAAQLAGIEDGIAEITRRAVRLLPAKRRTRLRTGPATIDLDGASPPSATSPGSSTRTATLHTRSPGPDARSAAERRRLAGL